MSVYPILLELSPIYYLFALWFDKSLIEPPLLQSINDIYDT